MKNWDELWKIAKDGKIQQKEQEWKEVIEMLSPEDKVIEIGSYDGGSTFSLAEVVDEVICIDYSNRWEVGKYENIVKFVGTSEEQAPSVKEYLGRKKVDMLIIDGDHSEEGVLNDYKKYNKFVRKGGVILFHDIASTEHHHRQGCFVDKAWAKIKEEVGEDNCYEIAKTEEHWGQFGVIVKP